MVNNYLTGFMGQSWVNTYNPRYPWLNEKSYNLLRQQGQDNEEEMDKYYKNNVKTMLNNQKLDEREVELNQVAYQNANINNGLSNAEWRLTKFSQDLKKQYNLKADANDVELFTDFVSALPDGSELADAYLWKWNMDLYRAAWLETAQDRLDMWASKATWGRFWVVNQQLWRTSILPNWKELVNPIWYATEALDNSANILADKITVTWEKAVNNLQNRVNNLSDKDIEEYRKIYNKMVANRDIRTQMVEWDTLVEQLRDGLTDWIKGTQEYGWDEEAFRKRVVQQEATLGESLIGADDTLNGINSPNVVKFFANLPESAVRTLTATLRWKTNPMDTYKWLIKLVGTKEWRQVLKDRYWSWDAIADLMNYDPVGTADDLLAVVDTFNSATKLGWKAFGSKDIAQNGLIGNYMPDRLWWPTNSIWSAVDATVDVWLNWGKVMYWSKNNPKSVDVSGLYWWMDNISKDNKILNAFNTWMQDTSSTSKLWEDTKNVRDNLKNKAVATAENIIQNDNRMTKKQQEKFKEITKEDQWKWQNDRDIRTNEDKVDYFERSKKKVDDAMDTIEGTFKSEEVNKIINWDEKLEGIVDYARDTEDPKLSRLIELQQKNNDGWLTMSEINEVKRYYERKQKMGYYKDNNSKKLDLATNRDSALREWQFKTAEKAWLDNLKQLNKETQAAKYIVDNTISWESWVKWNNPISLTDWIVMAWWGISKDGILGVVGKKIFTSSRFQNKIVDVLNYLWWHEKMDEINPNIEQIKQQNAIRRAMIEELQKVQNEQDFQKWLNDAKEIYETPRLPYNWDTVAWGYSTIVADANGNSWTRWANAEIDNRGF